VSRCAHCGQEGAPHRSRREHVEARTRSEPVSVPCVTPGCTALATLPAIRCPKCLRLANPARGLFDLEQFDLFKGAR